ncbi:MAG: VWA domain-containing protein [Thermoanaerobaculia bacterium]
MRQTSLMWILALILVLPSPAAAQTPHVYSESIEVRVATVDVVVTDSSGRYVPNLTRNDFELFENGQRRDITSFYEARNQATGAVTAEGGSPAKTTTAVVAPEPQPRHIVIFVDSYSLSPFHRQRMRDSVVRFAQEGLRPGDEIMLVSWNHELHIAVPFTTDREAVVHGVDALFGSTSGGFDMERSILERQIEMELQNAFAGDNRAGRMLEAYRNSTNFVDHWCEQQSRLLRNLGTDLERIISTMSASTGRKALVFVGEHLPMQVGQDMYQHVDEVFRPYASLLQNVRFGALHLRSGGSSQIPLQEGLQKTANTNGVALYMVDPAEPEAQNDAGMKSADSPAEHFMRFSNTAASFQEMAKATGGLALLASKNAGLAFDAVAGDLDHYYSLGYRPEGNREARAVKVRVERPGLTVRFRREVVVRPLEAEVRDGLAANAFTAPARNDLDVSLSFAAQRNKGRRRIILPVTVHIPSAQLSFQGTNDGSAAAIRILIGAIERKGTFSAITERRQEIRIATGKPLPAEIEYSVDVELRRTTQVLSVAVIDETSDAVGYARAELK